jgi:hypothetical protein
LGIKIGIATEEENQEIERFIADQHKKEMENKKRKKEIYKARGKSISEALQKKYKQENNSTNGEQLSLFD